MTTSSSGLTPQDLRSIVKTDAERVVAAINKGVSGISVVVSPKRPGGPSGNVYETLADALIALAGFEGTKSVTFDDTYETPIVVPAAYYMNDDVEFYGDPDAITGHQVQVLLADGVELSAMPRVSFGLVLRSAATTVSPVTMTDLELFVTIDNGATVMSDVGATKPFIRAPATLTALPVILLDTGGALGQTGVPVLGIDSPTGVLLVLEAYATLPDDVITGTGVALVAIDAGSAQSNTAYPINQPSVGTLAVVDYTSAPFVHLINLDPANWAGAPPTTVEDAIGRMASLLKTLNAGNPIP